MVNSVQKLDTSEWSPAAKQRLAFLAQQKTAQGLFRAAVAAHPFAGALDGLSDESRALSEAKRYRFKVVGWANGHREVTVAERNPNLDRTLERAIERDVAVLTPRGDGDRESSIERAARRAKQKVRYLAKSMGVNALWTLTYRDNVQDRELVLKHLDAFRRRVVALFGEWAYIAVIERQKRGAFHIHLATHALPSRIVKPGYRPVKSWDVMRAIWRHVAGEHGGNFDEAKRQRWGVRKDRPKPIMGAGAIASYIAGYVAKDMLESELNRKRYSASKGTAPPAICVEERDASTMHQLIEMAYEFIGERITRSWFDRARGVFFLESDDSRRSAGGPS